MNELTIHHARLGEIDAENQELFHFPGLPGFPEARRFAVRQHDRDSLFAWLVSADVEDLALPIVDPWCFDREYAPRFDARHLRAVDRRDGDTLQVLVVASFAHGAPTLNLAAPLLLNLRNRRGLQVILEEGGYSTRAPAAISSDSGESGQDEEAEGSRSSRNPRERAATGESGTPSK